MAPKKSPEAKIPVKTSDLRSFFISFTFFVKTTKYIPRQEKMTEKRAIKGKSVRRMESDMGKNITPMIGRKRIIKIARMVLTFFNNLRITDNCKFIEGLFTQNLKLVG